MGRSTHDGMTDSELNARVAVIEGHAGVKFHDGTTAPNAFSYREYATDWDWCGPLIEKYQLSVQCAADEAGIDWWACSLLFPHIITDRQDTPQRAICLAVIAIAEEGK